MTVRAVADALSRVLRKGLHARVIRNEDVILDLFKEEASAKGDDSRWASALMAEREITGILTEFGTNRRGDAARELFGTALHTRGLRLGERRAMASVSLDITERSFVRAWEDDIILDVAVELYRRCVLDSSDIDPHIGED